MGVNAMSLSTEYMGLKLKNPIVVAAGPWSRDGASIQRSIDAGASAVVTETITLEANQNPSPRLYLSGSGQLFNTTLFSGIHLEQWEQEFESLRRGDCKLIASIWGNTPSELAYLAGKVERMGADAVEVSLSAPLGTRMDVGTVPREIFGFISAVTEAVDIPVSVKLSYEASNFNGFTSSLEEAGVAGVTAIDALKGLMGVDLEHHRALMPTYGGYSGQYIRPIALATIATLKQTTGFPICGCGGINSAHDALEFIMLGAQSVQLASVLLRDSYEAIPRILGDLERWLEDHGYYSIEEVCGLALGSLQAFEELPPRPLTAHLTGGCNGCGKCEQLPVRRYDNGGGENSTGCSTLHRLRHVRGHLPRERAGAAVVKKSGGIEKSGRARPRRRQAYARRKTG